MSKIKKFAIKVNGKDYEVEVQEIPVERPRKPAPASISNRSKPISANGNGNIAAPMPGVITAVRVKVGDKVEAEQTVLTLEAMKMENEISAGKQGVVLQVNVEAGQSVSAGELLVVIE